MIEIHADDAAIIKAMTGFKAIPDDIAEEYGLRMRFASAGGHAGLMGLWSIVDMLRYLGHKPSVKKQMAGEPQIVRWRNVRPSTPVVVDADGHTFAGWFLGDHGQGVLSIQSPSSPHPREFFAKNVRLATESDDLSVLESGPAQVAPLAGEEDEELESLAHSATNQPADEDDERPGWTTNDIGREVLVEDGDAELIGTLVGLSEDSNCIVEITGEDGQVFQEEYPAASVFSNETPPVMLLARQEMDAERKAAEAAEEAAAKDAFV